jgi:L-lactate dehydrogenase complex protein LldG
MMPGESQEQFLQRVRTALSDRGQPVELPDEHEISRVIPASTDGGLIDAFAGRVEEAKMHPHRVAGEAAMIEKLAGLLRQAGARTAIVPADGLPARAAILERLQAENVELINPDDVDGAFQADVGITGVDAAIAETASLVLTSGDGRRRLASLAVPVHIAIVRADQIVPDLLDWSIRPREQVPANEVLVSAPSKTADIELALVMGVHGPKEEHVIILE